MKILWKNYRAVLSAILTLALLTSCTSVKSLTKPVDLTHAFDETTIYWPTEDGFIHEKERYGHTEQGYFYSSYRFSSAEHGGTHIDAPIHFNQSGQTLDQIPLDKLVGPAVVVDVEKACQKNPDYLITIDDFLAWEHAHNQSLTQKIVLLKTGYGKLWPDATKYLGTAHKGPDAIKDLHFPGLDPDAALWLIHQRQIRAVGIDTASIDFGQSTTFLAHRNLFLFNVPAFENVAHLDALPDFGFEIVALPMKIKDGSGGPLRIIALTESALP